MFKYLMGLHPPGHCISLLWPRDTQGPLPSLPGILPLLSKACLILRGVAAVVAAMEAVGIARAAVSVQRSNVEFCAARGNGELQREELDGLEPSRCGACASRTWVLFPSPCSSVPLLTSSHWAQL